MSNTIVKKSNEPIRHHYIPQFILRKFSFNERSELFYYSTLHKKVSVTNTREIFMESNLYRSEIVNNDNPTQIESDFSKFEGEISLIVSKKIVDKSSIELTLEEEQKLKYFCALLPFRSKNTKEQFLNFSQHSKDMYIKYQPDGKFDDMWMRNLAHLVKCRSLEEVLQSNNIDDPIKNFVLRDTEYLFGTYFSFLERRGNFDFIISDCYPVHVWGSAEADAPNGATIMNIFPISSKLIMLQVSNGANCSPLMRYYQHLIKKPKFQNDIWWYGIKKVYDKDVLYFNKLIFKHAKIGCAFQNEYNVSIEELLS